MPRLTKPVRLLRHGADIGEQVGRHAEAENAPRGEGHRLEIGGPPRTTPRSVVPDAAQPMLLVEVDEAIAARREVGRVLEAKELPVTKASPLEQLGEPPRADPRHRALPPAP